MSSLIKKHTGTFVVTLIAVAPIVLWLAGSNDITFSLSSLIAASGKAAALAGLALFALNPILSMRHRTLETLFGGLDHIYRLHAKTGKLAFWLILAHPVLLGISRLMSGQSFSTLWDWSSAAIVIGLGALVVFAVIVGISLYGHVRHQHWIIVHRILGWLIAFFYAHALLTQGKMTENPALFLYMFDLGVLGFCAFFYRSIISRYFIKRYPYEITEVNHLSPKITELVLKPIGVPVDYAPGQFAYVSFQSPAVDKEAHPFSFTTANNGPYIRFMIKSLGDDTQKIQGILRGSKAYLEGPFGELLYAKYKNKRQVWIAGGVGITPFLSMARSFTGKEGYEIHFFYATGSLDEAVFLQDFLDITRRLPDKFITSVVAKTTSGHVDTEKIKSMLGDLTSFEYLMCGPPELTKTLREHLIKAGVDTDHIHFENFSLK